MFVELVDTLRCVRPHEDTWLVAAAYVTRDRHIVDGKLGCPVCHAEYAVHEGVAEFTDAPADVPPPGEDDPRPEPDEALRAAALLHLLDVRRPVLLAGRWGALADALVSVASAPILVVNPVAPLPPRQELSALRARGAMPVAGGAMHAAALDAAAARDAALLEGAARAVRERGRLVAPVDTPLPAGYTELARDARHWVAERVPAPTAPVPLRRADRRAG